jgi:hypothetical protein
VGNSSDGIALNSRKLGPGVLSFPNGAPQISPLATNIGVPGKAQITGVGAPSGFVGTQYTPNNHYVPTVWLGGKPYRLPVPEWSSAYRPVPFSMDERQTAHGLRIDVVGTVRHREGRYGPYWQGTDYWVGRRTVSGYTFVEKRRFIRSNDMGTAYGISADGSMIFGVNANDGEGLVIYFTASHKSIDGSPGCGGDDGGLGWGDGHGGILVVAYYSSPWLCLAQPEH